MNFEEAILILQGIREDIFIEQDSEEYIKRASMAIDKAISALIYEGTSNKRGKNHDVR